MAKISTYTDGGAPVAADQFVIARSGATKSLLFSAIQTALQTAYASVFASKTVSATDKVLGRSSAGAGNVEEIPCTAAARSLLALANAFVDKTAFSPTISGGTTAGAGTYTTQLGYYSRVGNIVFFEVQLTWSAHTGTGQMRLSSLPIAAANNGINVPLTVYWTGITISAVGNKVLCIVAPATTYANFYEIADGATAALAIDTAATAAIAGHYFV